MSVVTWAANGFRNSIHVLHDSAHIRVKFIAPRIGDDSSSFFRAEDNMEM
jgi:hypothetical protein